MAVGGARRWVVVAIVVVIGVACGVVVAMRGSSTTTPRTSSTGSVTSPPSTTDGTATTGPDESPLVVAAGDIVCSPNSDKFNGGAGTDKSCRAMTTQALAASLNPAAVLALGDLQYECGEPAEYAAFASSWGTFGPLLRPAIGNHEYGHACDRDDASAYFSYFGDRAGEAGKGWYSFDLGAWHLVALNSECSYGEGAAEVGGCRTGSAQERWLRDDLAKHTSKCTLAYWHEPRFSSGSHGNNESMTDIWNLLVTYGADVVLNGHNHVYERFEPLGKADADAEPTPDPNGITEFVVGTGGKNLTRFEDPPLTGEVVRSDDTFGVLALTLRPEAFDWQFHPIPGGGDFTDAGSAACH